METAQINDLTVSRLLLGSNPFSGYSHQGVARDKEMIRYYTVDRIKQTLAEAEQLGITAVVARADHHVTRFLLEHWDEGGKLAWVAQTCPAVGPSEFCARTAIEGGAKACHIHGGVMDYLVAQGQTDEVKRAIDLLHSHGLPAGVAGHRTTVFEWAEKNLDVDYYMCCYYDPTPREEDPEHKRGAEEMYLEEDRRAMTSLIQTLSKPVIHYKILAAGRNNPERAFGYCSGVLRPQDMVCIGIYNKDDPGMLIRDVALFEKHCSSGVLANTKTSG